MIDRRALVSRHNIHSNDVAQKLALGNGEFCVTVDGTGLQTFAGDCFAHWGWHEFPLPDGWTPDQVPATGTFQQGRNRGFGGDVFPTGTEPIRQWMRDNPHMANLARIRLTRRDGRELLAEDIVDVDRTLDLWTGVHSSRFSIDGRTVAVETCVDPALDLVAVRIESEAVALGELEVWVEFPYPSIPPVKSADGKDTLVPGHERGTQTISVVDAGERGLVLERVVDDARYVVGVRCDGCAAAVQGTPPGPLFGKEGAVRVVADGSGWPIKLTVAFTQKPLGHELPTFDDTKAACASRLPAFWESGGAIDLSESRDPRWFELEQRIVLSRYLMGAMSAGSWPSSESGLFDIDRWNGRFHMEMVWWHLAHYDLWSPFGSETALECYRRLVPAARALAKQLGYAGLMWPKSVGPNGRSAPWMGNHVLLWKQPHPIFFAEMAYVNEPWFWEVPEADWFEIVEGTAEFMADYPEADADGVFHLTPAMPPSEQGITVDPVFDLAYWRWGLDMAQIWRERMGLPRNPHWDDVRRRLAALPVAGVAPAAEDAANKDEVRLRGLQTGSDSVYVHSAEWGQDTYTTRAWEHPDMVGVLGMLPPTDAVDADIARRTVAKVWETWDWSRCWGWDFPWMAMAAARTGQPEIAVEALLVDDAKNAYGVEGLNGGWYLPGNGGLLYAVAMMAAGWDGAPGGHAPGFPDDGSWIVRWEGLRRAP